MDGSYTVRNFIICTHSQISLDRSITANKVGGTCGTHGRGENSVQDFGGKALKKSPLGRPRRRWEDVIRMDIREFDCRV
jgi:hypothetical protein